MSTLFERLGQLEQMMLKASKIVVVNSGLTTYLGYCIPGTTLTSEAAWSICKITQDVDADEYEMDIQWANGQNDPDVTKLIFDNYASFTYTYPKF